MENARGTRHAAPLTLTRRGFAAAAALSALIPPAAAFAQSKPPGFTFYGSAPGDPQAWADALRLDPARFAPGQFEWWYADGHLSNGVTFVASWHLEIDEAGVLQPYVTVNFATKDEVLLDRKIRFQAAQARFGRERCDVAIGKHFIRSLDGLNRYELFVDPEINGGYGLHLELDRTVPSYSPGPDDGSNPPGPYVRWVCAVPNGALKGTVTVGRVTQEVTGSGYHDHNWGNVPMSVLVRDWHWARGEAEGYTAVAAAVRFNNGVDARNVYVADRKGVVVAALGPAVGFRELATAAQPDTGKTIGSDILFPVEGKGSVRFAGKKAISSFVFDSDAKFHWWYTRFDSGLEIDLAHDGRRFTATGHAVLEHMDFRGQAVGDK
ncbi:MAG: hypothetical protein F4092_02935 [Rhodospirillaceae bacterium]|nr:hypothetical protein [Rhodospirillaceae bacterium]MYJ70727.1 hypothetical protein [Rhodospirillaceae bacterium]